MEYSKYKRQNGYIRQNGVISISANVKVLYAGGDFGEGIFNLPHKPDSSTNVQ